MKLDEKDNAIIEELKADARSSIRDIAKKTKIRPSTVHQRIQRLVKEGVIERFTIKLDNKAVEENFIVFMNITTSKNLAPEFFRNRHIKEVFGITGEYDLMMKLKFKDIEEFNNFVIAMRKNPVISKTITSVATINIKEELN